MARKLVCGSRNVVVYYHMPVFLGKQQLALGIRQSQLHLLVRLAPAGLEPASQLVHRRSRDEDEDGVRLELLHLHRALRIDLQDDLLALRRPARSTSAFGVPYRLPCTSAHSSSPPSRPGASNSSSVRKK